MKAETIKKFGRVGRRYPFLHGVLSAWSGRSAAREKGGVTFHRDEDILPALLRTLERAPLREHEQLSSRLDLAILADWLAAPHEEDLIGHPLKVGPEAARAHV